MPSFVNKTGYTARSIYVQRAIIALVLLACRLALIIVHPITHKLKSSTDLVISEAVVLPKNVRSLKGEVVIITAGTP